MKPSRDEIAAAIRAADIGGPGSTVDHEEAAENVLVLLSQHPPLAHQGDPMTDIEKLEIQVPIPRRMVTDENRERLAAAAAAAATRAVLDVLTEETP